jgi:predicted ribosomally synthesized peptide with SipW-like signal peptide
MSGIGTWAYFSDVETSSGNVFAAGTLDLKTDDVDGVSQTLLTSNMMPGDIVGPETIILKNSGSLAGSSLDLSFSYLESDSSPNPSDMSADDTAGIIELITLNYDSASLLGSVSDSNTNGYKDVYDLSLADLSGLDGIVSLATKDFEIAVQLRSDASKNFQADGIDMTMTFILNQ